MDQSPDILPAPLLRPSPGYALGALARNGSLYILSLILIPLAGAWHPWAPLACMPLVGLAMYRLTIVLHDTVHGTLFASARANRILGMLVGAAAGIEFHAFQRLHWTHHRITGEVDDPQGPDYLLPATSSRGAILWHLFRPLLGWNVFKLWQVFRALAPQAEPPARRVLELSLVVAVQTGAAALVSGVFRAWWLAPLPVVSAATFGLFLAQLRGFAEHIAMPGAHPEGCVRSHRRNWIERVLLYDLNFNLHREHHAVPGIPSCHLPELHRRLAAREPGFELAPSMFATIRKRLRVAPSLPRPPARSAA